MFDCLCGRGFIQLICVNNFIDSYDNQCVCTYMLNCSDILAFFTAHATTSVCVGEQLMQLIYVMFLLTHMTIIYQCVCA